MKRDSLKWIITNDVMRILGYRYNDKRMLPALGRRFDSMDEDNSPHPAKRCALVNKARELSAMMIKKPPPK